MLACQCIFAYCIFRKTLFDNKLTEAHSGITVLEQIVFDSVWNGAGSFSASLHHSLVKNIIRVFFVKELIFDGCLLSIDLHPK